MKLKKAIGLLILSLPITISLTAQMKEGYKAEIEVQAIGTTNGTVPFWMRSNQFGSIPLNGVSGSVIGRLSKDYDEPSTNDQLYGRKNIFDWGFGLEGRANGGKNSNVQLIEGYVKAKAGVFQLKAGRSKDVMGLNGDTTLSSGNFAISGNALGIPRIELSIPEYYRLPILDGLFSFKGNFAHGWIGKTRILDSTNLSSPNYKYVYHTTDLNPQTYFHQKSIYVRLGKDHWKINLFGGFSHQVFWGNEVAAYGPNYKLSSLKSFFYVATGKAYGTFGVPSSKIGNQLGSIDLAGQLNFEKIKLVIYRQSFYDVGALAKLANISDGLNGLSVENKLHDQNNLGWQWKKIVLEVFASKNQAGYPWSTPTASGDEDYYNNYYYLKGWSYKGVGLGNPLITRKEDAKSGQASSSLFDYFINNRVLAFHTGMSGTYKLWSFSTKLSYSFNYGTFGTSIYGKSTGGKYFEADNIFNPVEQLSTFISGSREFDGQSIGFDFALDLGKLLDNSTGLVLKYKRRF